jgi:hypothetical protein
MKQSVVKWNESFLHLWKEFSRSLTDCAVSLQVQCPGKLLLLNFDGPLLQKHNRRVSRCWIVALWRPWTKETNYSDSGEKTIVLANIQLLILGINIL